VYQRERPRNSISDQEPDITVVKPERPDAAARITIPGFEQNQKNGVSALSAKRGCALTIRASARNSSEEPNIADFEILSATAVNAEACIWWRNAAILPMSSFSPA
jgi:hypothetical protein